MRQPPARLNSPCRHPLVAVLAGSLLATLVMTTASAANTNRTWTGNAGAPGNWSVAGNWNSLPEVNDNLFFYGSAQTLTTNDRGDDFQVRKIEFHDPAPAYTVAGQRIALSSTGIFNYSLASQTFTADINLLGGAAPADARNGDLVFDGVLSGSGELTPRGNAEVYLNNNLNTFTGNLNVQTTVHVGSIKTNTDPSAVGQGSRIVLGNQLVTGTLNYTGTGDTWSRNLKIGENQSDVSHTGGGVINNNGSGPLVITAAQSFTPNNLATAPRLLTFGGANLDANDMQMVIVDNNTGGGGTVGVVKADLGTWRLSGNNTYTGPTEVQAGTLILNRNGGAIRDTAPLLVSGGTLQLNFDETVGAVTLAGGAITGTGKTLTGSSFAVHAGSIASHLAGAGAALAKSTGGTVVLNGDNSYTGGTTVSAGTLLVNGTTSGQGNYLVSGGRLGGTGSIGLAGGSVTVDAAGTLAPGESPGTLTVNGDVVLAGVLEIEIAGTGSGEYDLLVVNGNLAVDGDTAVLKLIFLPGYTPVGGESWTIIGWDTLADGSGFYAFDLPLPGPNFTWNLDNLFVDGTLTLEIPEPTSVVLLALAGLALRSRRRRA